MAKSWLLYHTNLQNKTQCAGFFTRTYKRKHNIDGTFLLRDYQKVSISILFQKACLGWKLSPTIKRRGGGGGGGGGGGWGGGGGGWSKNVLDGKKSKNKLGGGGTSFILRNQE